MNQPMKKPTEEEIEKVLGAVRRFVITDHAPEDTLKMTIEFTIGEQAYSISTEKLEVRENSDDGTTIYAFDVPLPKK